MSWPQLHDELDRWSEQGLRATFWWRDDDAVDATAALDRLLGVAHRAGLALTLAVIPEGATPQLASRLAEESQTHVVQHGYSHRNHAQAGGKKVELASCRPRDEVSAELQDGWRRICRLFGRRALPVLVPPWNRIADEWLAELPRWGFLGLSTFGPRPAAVAEHALKLANTHVDPIDWRGTSSFAGEAAALRQALEHLRQRRMGLVDRSEPTGLLSHHLRHDRSTWEFCERFVAETASHPAVRWLAASEVFDLASAAPPAGR